MDKIKILWADDEIDLLKPQTLFLEKKGYDVTTVSNGHDAIDEMKEVNDFDVVFLDESMPGISGLETLTEIKKINPHIPVVMITKNEAENIMEEAIGSQISDYLIKPVNPLQILLALKRLIDHKKLVSEKLNTDYQKEFREISMRLSDPLDFKEWPEIYKTIIDWELKMANSESSPMEEILNMQKAEANKSFAKYINRNYIDWMTGKSEKPVTSDELLKKKVFNHMDDGKPTFFFLLDNLRYDQWKILEPYFYELFKKEEEDYFYSILPTTTQYSRNSIFAGMSPRDIEKNFPELWKNDIDEGGKNLHEHELLEHNIKRSFHKEISVDYVKITTNAKAKALSDNIHNYLHNDFTAIVYNFIDMLSHARTEMEVLKQLASDEKAYRSLTLSWFLNSPLYEVLQTLAEKDVRIIVTTDHGTIRVQTPSKVVGDKNTTTNLRYKVGRALKYNRKDVLEIKDPNKVGLPSPNLSSTFIFGLEDTFFLYPNNYNYYNHYFKDTFQHGGVSLEEVICPIIRMSSK